MSMEKQASVRLSIGLSAPWTAIAPEGMQMRMEKPYMSADASGWRRMFSPGVGSPLGSMLTNAPSSLSDCGHGQMQSKDACMRIGQT
jgi:hypothetical protein